MKPDWKDAPEWAQWLAMDSDGRWFWYETEPVLLSHAWFLGGRFQQEIHQFDVWDESLEPRP